MYSSKKNTLEFLQSQDPTVTRESEQERRLNFPQEVLDRVFEKFRFQDRKETREKKRTIEVVENAEAPVNKKQCVLCVSEGDSDDGLISFS